MTAEMITGALIIYIWFGLMIAIEAWRGSDRVAAWFRLTLPIWPIGLALYLVFGIFWLIVRYLRYLRTQVRILLKGEDHG